MKTRIQELRDQCIEREQRGTNAFNSYVVDIFNTERFAELIVKECADIATMNQHQWASAGSYVLEHFGVE